MSLRRTLAYDYKLPARNAPGILVGRTTSWRAGDAEAEADMRLQSRGPGY